MENLTIYNALKQPPREVLRTIQGGRLAGKTDINPQWRYKAMTEQFGVCGIGWKYEIVRAWSEPASEGQIFAFAEVSLFIHDNDKWSDAIPGYGGSMLIEKEKAGLHCNDEAYKMAITDALSVAMKMLGVAADIYAGLWDGTKYRDTKAEPVKPETKKSNPVVEAAKEMGAVEATPEFKNAGEFLMEAYKRFKLTKTQVLEVLEVKDITEVLDLTGAWVLLKTVREAK